MATSSSPSAEADVRLQAPRVYQKFGAEERSVERSFRTARPRNDEVGFKLGAYDRSRTLIIDPILTYSTYLGGSGNEACSVIAPITVGIPSPPPAVLRLRWMQLPTPMWPDRPPPRIFPRHTANYQPDLAPGATANVFIAKFSPTGVSAVFHIPRRKRHRLYRPGSRPTPGSILSWREQRVPATFPPPRATNTAFQTTPVTGGKHVFVSKLDPTGRFLLYSTYLSGHGTDIASGLGGGSKGQ